MNHTSWRMPKQNGQAPPFPYCRFTNFLFMWKLCTIEWFDMWITSGVIDINTSLSPKWSCCIKEFCFISLKIQLLIELFYLLLRSSNLLWSFFMTILAHYDLCSLWFILIELWISLSLSPLYILYLCTLFLILMSLCWGYSESPIHTLAQWNSSFI